MTFVSRKKKEQQLVPFHDLSALPQIKKERRSQPTQVSRRRRPRTIYPPNSNRNWNFFFFLLLLLLLLFFFFILSKESVLFSTIDSQCRVMCSIGATFLDLAGTHHGKKENNIDLGNIFFLVDPGDLAISNVYCTSPSSSSFR